MSMWYLAPLFLVVLGFSFRRSSRRSHAFRLIMNEKFNYAKLFLDELVTEVTVRNLTRDVLLKKGVHFSHRDWADHSPTTSRTSTEWWVIRYGREAERIEPTRYDMGPREKEYTHVSPGVVVGEYLAGLDEADRQSILEIVLVDYDDFAIVRPRSQATIYSVDAESLHTWLKEGGFVKPRMEVSGAVTV